MPKNQRPSYLKRQKEQQRKARAEQKREARSARRAGARADDDSATNIETSAESAESEELNNDES
jgi:hypothetical protein